MQQDQLNYLRALEASVLGAILLRRETLSELPKLEVDDMLDLRHRAVFAAMRNLESRNEPIDVVTVEGELVKHGNVAVGFSFLGELALEVPTPENARDYAAKIREASLARRVRDVLEAVIARSAREELTGGELLSAAMERLSVIDEDQPDEAVNIAMLVKKRFNQLDKIAEDRKNGVRTMTGFPTGVAKLDEKIGGIQPGIVTIVAARPGMGKSSLGLAIADGASAGGFGVHLFSLEDTEEAYADRTLARMSGVPAERLRNAELLTLDPRNLTSAVVNMRGRRWIVDGRSGITAEEIVRSVRRHRRNNGTCVVIVDYVQLVKRAPRMSPHEALSEIVTTLADAAKADRMAYVVMSQLNRQLESRQDKRPLLSDLRESGSLEERAKCVIGIYRGAKYGEPVENVDYSKNWKERQFKPSPEEHEREVQLLVLKNSNGRTGTVFAQWDGPTTRIW